MIWNRKAKKAAEILLTIGILIFLALIAVVNVFHFNYKMNADLASEAILAKLIWTSKDLIPSSWYSSTETRIISTPNLAALFFGLTGNMILSQGLACLFMTILIFASILYFGKKAELGRAEAMLIAFLGLALSTNMTILELLYLFASYYAVHVVALFLTLGIYVEGIRQRKLRWKPAIFSLSLALCLGIQGKRGILVTYGPLFGIEIIRVIYQIICKVNIRDQSLGALFIKIKNEKMTG